jgi:hypothetical protein
MIFLSYSREDKTTAAELATALYAQGFEVSRDPELVQGDPFWRLKVRRALDESALLVVLWSRHAACSPWVDQEIRYFDRATHFLILDQEELPTHLGTRVFQLRLNALGGINQAVAEIVSSVQPQKPLGMRPRASDRECEYEQWSTDGNDLGKVSRKRNDYATAEETGLQRFCHNIGYRVASFTQTRDGSLKLSDGSRLIRLPDNSSRSRERAHALYIAATPVTNNQYREFVGATGLPTPVTWRFAKFTSAEAPVTGVTWFQAMAYAAWIGGDLPTEEEWEAAATGDSNIEYATSNGQISDGAAHFGVPFAEGSPRPSLAYSPNPLGFYGMCGNTWDWCSTADGDHRRICGGGYMDSARFCKVKAVYRNAPIDADCSVGFRIKVAM